MEILQSALQMLPDSSDLDSKLLVPMESAEDMELSISEEQAGDACSGLDRLMCEIIDAL
jgi:mediator of RNA polymerase II transcription subunit 7